MRNNDPKNRNHVKNTHDNLNENMRKYQSYEQLYFRRTTRL